MPRSASYTPVRGRCRCGLKTLNATPAAARLSFRSASRWLVIVAPGGRAPDPHRLRAFVASGVQGVNYARGTWHHPLIVLDHDAEFLVVDRVADDGVEDCAVSNWPGLETRLYAGPEGLEIRMTLES